MALYFAQGSAQTVLTDSDLRDALHATLRKLGAAAPRARPAARLHPLAQSSGRADLRRLRVLRRATDRCDAGPGHARPDDRLAA